jgi:DNA-binding response OmpR family regulator
MNAGRVGPYTRLVEYAWGYAGYAGENRSALLKPHISSLRRKLGLSDAGPGGIRAILGAGYMLNRA